MHPTYVIDRPGDCPICNMKLVPIKDAAPVASTPVAAGANAHPGQSYCPMHPTIVSDAPGLCPECHMTLVEKKPGPTAPPGRVAVMISPGKQQLIGLKSVAVERRELSATLHIQAVVEHDETRYARVAPRFAGWIRSLKVNATGANVEKGQPLFAAYSPELFVAQNEYLLAWRQARQLSPDASAAQRADTRSLLDAARQRLALWEVGDDEIRALEERGTPSDEVWFRSPLAGHVIAKTAIEGRAFMMGETLFEIGAMDPLWLRAAIAERDLPQVRVGQKAWATFPHLPGRRIETSVSFVYPHLDPATRRAEVRLELRNPGGEFRPAMWANVELEADLGTRLALPASAVIDTGPRQVAFVLREEHHLEPREVQIGARTDDWWEVLSGVSEGETVVTRALFLVDSESQLKAAVTGMAGGH
jgi:Cu(I)/Ag(I) efflux system membrane fusion protein